MSKQGEKPMVNPFSIFFFEILTPEVTTAHFDLQVVILEAILHQWSTQTVMGTEIGANPHGESILTILMSLTFPSTALLTFLTSKWSFWRSYYANGALIP